MVQTWTQVILNSLQDLWVGFVGFLPALLGAIIVFILGWIIAAALGKVTVRALQTLKADKFFDQLGVMRALHRAGLDWQLSGLLGALVKWFFIIAFFLAAVDILKLTALADFLRDVLLYIPNIVVAALIVLVGALIADFLERVVVASVRAAELSRAKLLGAVARWSVWVFALLAAVAQLGVATSFMQTLFTGFVALLALAGGLAFGLGGQGVAKELLEGIKKDISEK